MSVYVPPMPLLALQVLEKKIERRIRRFERKNGLRILDEFAFIRSWIEKPILRESREARGANIRSMTFATKRG